MIPFQLLIKPAGPDCNLKCAYCFYRRIGELFPTNQALRMSRRVAEEMIKQYLNLEFPVSCFSWQGGEPTLCGLDFFQEAVRLQMKHGRKGQVVSNAFQTNGILLNADWCRFFNRYKFLIGLSLDGPQSLHDFYRKRNDEGSWGEAMRAAGLLSDYQVEFNILAVVTRKSEANAKELFYWFLEHGFRYVQFIPCLERTAGKEGLTSFSATADGYGDFLCELFDLWWENRNQGISIRLFDTVIERLISSRPSFCVFSPDCRSYLVVEHNGSVYPCDFFVSEETCLGNLVQKPLDEIFRSPVYQQFGKQKSALAGTCRGCRWLSLCWGGCQKDRVDEQGRPTAKTFFCRSCQRFFSHAMPRLLGLAEELQSLSLKM